MISWFSTGSAQDSTLFNKISIASPTAASLGKYGDIPVSYHTGIPNIGLPIYTVKEGPLQLPVSLSYHAGGLKVMEPASWVGTGWALNAGGVITRTVKGAPDDRGFGAVTNTTHGHFTDYGYNSYLFITGAQGNGPPMPANGTVLPDDINFQKGIKDGEPDLYFFNFGNYSGKFYFRDDRTAVILPEADFKIEPVVSAGTVYISAFVITTPDGVKYYFGKNQSGDGNIDAFETTDSYTSQGGIAYGTAISSWYLNKIVSADNQFSIKLIYQPEKYSYYTVSTFPVASTATPPDTKGYSLVKSYVSGVRLAAVSFSNGTVNLLPGAVRKDLGASMVEYSGMGDSVNTQAKALGAIQITDSAGYCKSFVFYQSYFTDNSTFLPSGLTNETINTDKRRLRLDSIQEKTCNGGIGLPPYKFAYTAPATDTSFVIRRLSFAQDHWGFYNGQTGNAGLIPTYTVNKFSSVSGANRESSWPEMSYGSLKAITYPTGGKTQFEFESHDTYLSFNYYVESSRASAATGPGIGQSGSQTVNITASGNPYKLTLQFHTNPTGNSTGSASFGGLSVDKNNPSAEIIIQPTAGPQSYTLSQNNMTSGNNDYATASVYEEVLTSYGGNKIVGGLRIKKMYILDGLSATADTTFYTYRTSNQSTGVLYSRPTYVQVPRNDLAKQVGYSNPSNCSPNGCAFCDAGLAYLKSPCGIRPMGTTQGNHIGYSEVMVSKPGNGYSIYRYYGSNVWDSVLNDVSIRNVDLSCSASIPNYPDAPEAFDYKRGELKYEGTFKEGGQLIQESTHYPVFVSDSVSTPAYLNNYWGITLYQLTSARKTQVTTVFKYFASPGVALTTFDSSFFGSRYHHQVTRRVAINSKGEKLETRYKYAQDFVVPSCDTIATGFSAYTGRVATATSTFNSQLFTCTSGTWNCKWVAFQQYRYDMSLARIGYVSLLRSNFTNATNVYKTNHDNVKASADAVLKPILQLQDKNIFAPIEVTTWKLNQLAGATFTKYSYSNNPSTEVYPEIAQKINLNALSATFVGSSNTNTTLSKDSRYMDEASIKFTLGNVVEQAKQNDVTASFIWDNRNTLPVAHCVGASQSEIAYTSFEADGAGNWSGLNTANLVTAGGLTGKKYYSANNFSLIKNGLSSTSTYTVSYWSKNGAFNVNSTSPLVGRSYNGWTFYEHSVANPVNGTITVAGTGAIDELRLYPKGAQMQTYSYEPLIGIASACDANNRIIYYEYDVFNRLSLIRDQNGNVVKKYAYNYAGQVPVGQ